MFREQFMKINSSLRELDYYSDGTRESLFGMVNEGREAREKVDQMVAWQEEHKDSVLDSIHENWANGLFALTLCLG
jgi:hypothetical protein